jgi:hypothetical protein
VPHSIPPGLTSEHILKALADLDAANHKLGYAGEKLVGSCSQADGDICIGTH